ncbi:tRNA preQ1(34) S-adenosylmethionine ribosyltransferase-isomerase QueA [Dictyoglomus thermophilum]|uniref:S-adenosylmethionine:tRNA ribosyltransferase-isomerase n=1 Tax=Dictyoglomus thermophilum (strain ATCC 35947 / DSM 3960 / H-6-12) TaxID=309799 RepID=B5YFK6_DICT6|nr:tRNA preQ1(34) S-adenosylmethionine ribosyltransferase-isomerase QueA [Dictyoglomus thermophilum]ACI19976.1 S-adenosylmethionine:tRNA ribosyltransferase-isomerase [Dictyoglomus thermophilum H-6-12]
MVLKLSDYDYYLPEELIAQEPAEPRDTSRLMLVNRKTGEINITIFREIKNYLKAGDVLVLNNTKVIPARLYGKKETGAKIEVLLLKKIGEGKYEALLKPGKRAKIGTKIHFLEDIYAEVVERNEEGIFVLKFSQEDLDKILPEIGNIPLPPYIKKPIDDPNKYQTVYAQKEGAVAAPTAGLHFTEELLKTLGEMGVEILYITLHVGLGTFRPVVVEDITKHKLDPEYFEVSDEVAERINKAKEERRRVIAVGTTVTRVLEAQGRSGKVEPGSGLVDLFIYPGFEFKIIDGLITNFHLPKSTLLMLVAAFMGYDLMKKAYNKAIEERMRFYSFGDAMFIY